MSDPTRKPDEVAKSDAESPSVEDKLGRGMSGRLHLDRLLPYLEPRLGSELLSRARLNIRLGRVVTSTPKNRD